MLFTPDCISCVYKASLGAIRELTGDEHLTRRLVSGIMAIPSMRGEEWGITSPEVFEQAFNQIYDAFHSTDPFRAIKDRQNEKGIQLYPFLKSLIADSDDPLYTASHLAVIGNSLDLLWSEGSVNIEPIISEKLNRPLRREAFEGFAARLKRSRRVVYLGDNSGEVVFDKVLIEVIRDRYDIDPVFVVRSVPALNDATLKEATEVGMQDVAVVVDNGIDGPVPGTLVSRCSSELKTLLADADLIISKGGGNFDSLEEEKPLLDRVVFMLMSKCVPYCSYFGAAMYDPILSGARQQAG